jgi:[ribosomal protein S5]-alanine N-acetyltransferase
MEKMPYQPHLDSELPLMTAPTGIVETNWRHGLPVLAGLRLTLRELRPSDAASLFAMLTTEEVSRFISPPPTTVEGFERFIAWTIRQRGAGDYVCFAVVPKGSDDAVGLFQVRSLEPGFGTAEWGFALGSNYWGTGMFADAAALVLDYVFGVMRVHRVEARAAVRNGRGNGALRKIGAIQEGVLRRSFLRNGEYLDQVLWSIVAEDWLQAKAVWGPRVIH